MTETIKTFRKYPVCPLSANSIGEKYINGVKCYLYLGSLSQKKKVFREQTEYFLKVLIFYVH